MEYILLTCFFLSFLVTIIVTPFWIKRAKKAGLVGKDIHKFDKREVAEVGGVCVILGFLLGVFCYIAIQTFYFHNYSKSLEIMAILTAVLIAAFIGLIDDILGWKIGLRQWQKPFLTLLIAMPILVINLGQSTLAIPFLGRINIGLLYPLLFVPIGIVGAANAFNMIAGYNGLEAGLGIIILSALTVVSYFTNVHIVTIISLIMIFALLAFLIFNKYPSKIFPGDTLTYSVGALIAIMTISGNMERIALIIFIPYFVELILKLRGKLQKQSFSKVNEDGSLELMYDKFYGIEHIAVWLLKKVKKKVYERDVVYSIYLVQIIFVAIALLYWIQ